MEWNFIVDLDRDVKGRGNSLEFEQRKFVVFGASKRGKELVERLPLNIECFIDNDQKKWGQLLADTEVRSPELLRVIDKNEFIVLVASAYYREIATQLSDMGFVENKHFYCGDDVIDRVSREGVNKPSKSYNDLRPLTIADYNFGFEKLINFIDDRFECVSIYNFGDISHPSISDFDLLFVFNEEKEELFEIKRSIDSFIFGDDLLSYLFVHPPIVLNIAMAIHLKLFHSVRNLQLLRGQPIDFGKDSFQEERTMIWNYRVYLDFLDFFRKDKLGYREFCLKIKNMFHSVYGNSEFLGKRQILDLHSVYEDTINISRKLALHNNLNIHEINSIKDRMVAIIELQENWLFNSFENDVSSFPNEYRQLYETMVVGSNLYLRTIDSSLKDMQLTYNKARILFGALAIFDLPQYH